MADTMDMGTDLASKIDRLRWIGWAVSIYFASLGPDQRQLCHCASCVARRANQSEQVVPDTPREFDGPPRWDPPPDEERSEDYI